MSDIKLSLEKRTIAGKKLAGLRADGLIPSVIYGGKEPILAQSTYNDTEKALKIAGYHSAIDLTIDGKKAMAIVKNVALDPVSRKIMNVEFQAISANEVVEATTLSSLLALKSPRLTSTFISRLTKPFPRLTSRLSQLIFQKSSHSTLLSLRQLRTSSQLQISYSQKVSNSPIKS